MEDLEKKLDGQATTTTTIKERKKERKCEKKSNLKLKEKKDIMNNE